MDSLTPYGTIILLLAIMGAGTLATLLVSLAGDAIARNIPKMKQTLVRWHMNRNLRRHLKTSPRLSDHERQALRAGADEAIAAFERAQLAMVRR